MKNRPIKYPRVAPVRLSDEDLERLDFIKEALNTTKRAYAIREAIREYYCYLKVKQEINNK